MPKTQRVTKHEGGMRGLIYVIVGPNGEGANKLLELLEEAPGRIIFSIAPAGDSIHYVLQNMPMGMPDHAQMVPGQQLR